MNYFEMIFPFVHEENLHVVTSIFVVLLLFVAAFLVWRNFRFTEKWIIPSKKLTLGNIFEAIIEFFYDKSREMIGDKGPKYVPFIGTVFIYILVCDLLGLIPGFIPPTENMNTNLACALIVFVATHYFGIREHGFKYVKKFMAPVSGIFGIFLSLIFFPIEIFSNLFRPMSLSIRLFGNINGDHTVMSIFTNQIPILKSFPMVVPIAFLFLGLLVSVLQAFIFSLLSLIYISLAVSHEH
jgi:F-type H+-transporting ATPase subunit a